MLKSNARTIWLFPDICKSEIEIKEIWRRVIAKNNRFSRETKEIEIKIDLEWANIDNSYSDGKIRVEAGGFKDKKNNKDENKKEKLSYFFLILNLFNFPKSINFYV